MTIRAKFASTCQSCRQRIDIGESVEWARGRRGVTHTVCPPPPAQTGTVTTTRTVFDASAIVAFLTRAQTHLKRPRVRFLAADGTSELLLSLAVAGFSKYPGAVNVKLAGQWIGRINVDGTVVKLDAGILATLATIATNPAQAAAAYGHLMGHCGFCNLKLTDAGSTDVGYGPICARHYGLPHKALGTPTLTTPVPEAAGFVPAVMTDTMVDGIAVIHYAEV